MSKVRYSRKTDDGQVSATPAFLHTVSIAPTTATPTTGLLSVYDNAAETGTVVFSTWVFATDPAKTITLDVQCDNGIYVGYDATLANVSVTVGYRP